jgi:hypothetical protein
MGKVRTRGRAEAKEYFSQAFNSKPSRFFFLFLTWLEWNEPSGQLEWMVHMRGAISFVHALLGATQL